MPDHSFGWRPSLPDRRDILFSATNGILQNLPPVVDLTAGMGPVLDQGRIGSCGPHSLDSLVFYNERVQGLTVDGVSRLFVYYNTRVLMNTVNSDSGVDNRTMLKAVNRFGACEEVLWKYTDNGQTYLQKPPQDAYEQAARNLITDYASVPQSAQLMRACLAGGRPFLFGFTVYESFESPQVVQTGMVQMPRRGESVLGGHDIVICGYDINTGLWRFKNSWGRGWGDDGYGYFPSEYVLSPDLSSDFWVINKVPGGVVPTPTPTPPPPTTVVLTLSTTTPGGKYTLVPTT